MNKKALIFICACILLFYLGLISYLSQSKKTITSTSKASTTIDSLPAKPSRDIDIILSNPLLKGKKYVPGRILVKLTQPIEVEGASVSDTATFNAEIPVDAIKTSDANMSLFKDALKKIAATDLESLVPSNAPITSPLYLVHIAESQNVNNALLSLKQQPLVAEAELDYVYFTTQSKTIRDPYFLDPSPRLKERDLPLENGGWNPPVSFGWNIQNVGIDQGYAPQYQRKAVVAVVDTGVDYNHPELAHRMWSNPREIENNGIDDDRNGYIDDVKGWDAVEYKITNFNHVVEFEKRPDNNPVDDPTESYFSIWRPRAKSGGHGTAVAGIIAAESNTYGSLGINQSVQIMPLRVCTAEGMCTLSAVTAMTYYAINNGADVINYSLGYATNSIFYLEAIQQATNKGIVIAASAGNDGVDGKVNTVDSYPADYPGVISVAAHTYENKNAEFSHKSQTVMLSAPGEDVLTLRGQGTDMACVYDFECSEGAIPFTDYVKGQNRDHYVFGGTSASSPHVAAAASVLKAVYPELTSGEITNILLNAADDAGAPGYDVEFGYGKLNIKRALAEKNTSPPQRPINKNTPYSKAWKFFVDTTCENGQPAWRTYTNTVKLTQLIDYGLDTEFKDLAISEKNISHTFTLTSNNPREEFIFTPFPDELRNGLFADSIYTFRNYPPEMELAAIGFIISARDDQSSLLWVSTLLPSGTYTIKMQPNDSRFSCATRTLDLKLALACKDKTISMEEFPADRFELFHAAWPPNPFTYELTPITAGMSSYQLSSYHTWNYMYVGLFDKQTNFLKPIGTPPHNKIIYGTAFKPVTPMAYWYAGDLPIEGEFYPDGQPFKGLAPIQFEAPADLCTSSPQPTVMQGTSGEKGQKVAVNLQADQDQIPGHEHPYDLNNDSVVNAFDLSIMFDEYVSASVLTDVNSDGKTNALDLSAFISHFGTEY